MTDARSPETPPDDPQSSVADADSATATAEAPAPEPWTAAKVLEWNAYYDLYVVIAVLLLTFLGATNLMTDASVWTHLRAGEELSQRFDPGADPFSYSQPEARWVHIPWLSDLVHYQVFNFLAGFASAAEAPAPGAAPGPPPGPSPAGEQWGIAGITVMDALVRVAAVLVLLAVRRKGPGLWWAAVCVAVTLAVFPLPLISNLRPVKPVIGGVGGIGGLDVLGRLGNPIQVGSQAWGLLFFAIELLVLFRAFDRGRARALYGLVPLFLVWANVDESFLLGLIVLAAAVVGGAVGRRDSTKAEVAEGQGPPASPKVGLIILAASALACLVNPSLWKVYPAALSSLLPLPGWLPAAKENFEPSFFAHLITRKPAPQDDPMVVIFAALVAVGLATFALNRRRFSAWRLLVFLAAAAAWALNRDYATAFAAVLAVVATLNGQEWYQDRAGTEGHLGRGWAIWSTGGRAATFGALALVLVLRVILGWWADLGEPRFGFGFDPGDFAFEAAEAIKSAPVEGQVFNSWPSDGDALVWRAYPRRKSFVDSRRHLFGSEVLARYDKIRAAIRDDDVATWRPMLDDLGATVLMIDARPGRATNTYRALLTNRNWIRFYDDGDHALFGRSDAKGEDLAYFRKHEMNAENLAYSNPEPVPSSSELPRATSALDQFDKRSLRARANPHTLAAARWLHPAEVPQGTAFVAEPARCFMAIRDARRAIVANPSESLAYLLLADAYSTLLNEESALIAGIEPTAANVGALAQVAPQHGLLPNRYRQLVTALHYALLTSPPPQGVEDGRALADLNLRLYQVFSNRGIFDLARDHLEAWQKLAQIEDYQPERYTELIRQLEALNKHVDGVRRAVSNLGLESQANPIQKAGFAQAQGAIGLAIQLLEEAKEAGINPALIKPTLLDLYCEVGEPDKAGELWTAGNFADPTLGDNTESPALRQATAALRQGRVYFLLGNYSSALAVWNREAIPTLRGQRTLSAPVAARTLLEGQAASAARTLLTIPEDLARQAAWEFEVGMASLEAGEPVDQTASHLTNALKLAPRMAVRPVIAYYLKKLGRPVPEIPVDAAKAVTPSTEAAKDAIPSPSPAPAAAKP